MGKRKTKKKVKESDKKVIKDMLDNIPDFNETNTFSEFKKISKTSTNSDFEAPTTSAEADRISKIRASNITNRRDAIDTPPEAETESDDSSDSSSSSEEEPRKVSIGTQTTITLSDSTDFLSFKNEFNTDLKSFKNSILYNIKKLDAKFEMNYVSKNTKTIGDITTKLNLKEPIDDLNIFKEFDEQIKTDAEFAESLNELFAFKSRADSIEKAIAAVLSTVMSHDLQLKFSACGKPNKGVSKENLSITQLYIKLKEFLLPKFVNESEATMISKTSRWLAAARDRTGGRNHR